MCASEQLPGARVSVAGYGWRHAGRKAPTLSGINCEISPGRRVLLLGESGSGKSTFLAALAGVLGGDEDGEKQGSIHINGVAPEQARGLVGMVLQDPDSQVISSRVGDDVAFGCENLGIATDEIWRRVRAALDMVGLDLPLDHPTAELSGGQKQRLALAGVIAMGARLILLDEPTANLDPDGVAEVRAAVDTVVRTTGATLIVVEHRVDIWSDIIDDVIVIGSGERGIIAHGPLSEIIANKGQELADSGVWIPARDTDLPAAAARPITQHVEDPALRAVELHVGWSAGQRRGPIHSFAIPAGASTVIRGANGVGKSTLALTLAGLLPPLSGQVVVSAAVAEGLGGGPDEWASRDLASRIGFVFQDPEHQFVARTVREELLVGPRVMARAARASSRWGRWWGTRTPEISERDQERVTELLQRLRLTHLADANPFSLSGGQKRRLSVATALVTSPSIVIMDEPTFGQDRRTFRELVALLRELVEEGVTLVSISHDDRYAQVLGDYELVVSDAQ